MDTTALVGIFFADGQKLVDQLPREGFEVTTAFWMKKAENGEWYFYIVSPNVDSERHLRDYGRLHTIIRAMPEPFSINPFEVKLIEPADPIAQDVLRIQQRSPRARVLPGSLGVKRLGNASIEGAYLYPQVSNSAS
jgi:hypothetical protein